MNIELKRPSELSDSDWSHWQAIQEGTDVYESPYFRTEFVRAVARVRSDVEVAVLSEGDTTVGFFPFQRGRLNLGKPIGGKLSDYHGPLVRPGTQLDPPAMLEACRLASWDFDHLVCTGNGFESFVKLKAKSPQLDLTEGFTAYAHGRKEAGSDAVHRQSQKTRKLTREVGPLKFDVHVDDAEACGLLCRWKSDQLLQSSLPDVFAFPWVGQLLDELRSHRGADFTAPLTVLRAGEKVAAVCLSLLSRGVLHAWFAAYNPELSTYSPGMTLFIRLAEEAQQAGICKIDLGRGEEHYKWRLASGSVPVAEGSVSRPSVGTLLRTTWRKTRDWVAQSPLAPTTRLLKPIREWMAYQ
ncbi:MAG TPA: GNAT family N-acetyltransferase [Pirellulaceae bacterium]|jgi:CelD/BcsL family acetyltransferase involved in cellulose biosynthesis